jgi:hypothetical protein
MDQNEKKNSESIVTLFAAAGGSFSYDSWLMIKSTLSDGCKSPFPNYLNPFPWPDPEEPDL